MIVRAPRSCSAIIAALVLGAFPGLAAAQSAQGVPNALQGFSQNRDKPVQIEAATLEVRDKDKVATFSGNVHVTQGDTNLRSKSLVVFYDQGSDSPMKTAQPGPGGQQSIRRLEAKGGVVVTQKDQTATGDNASFDMRTNTVTLLGNVLVTQGQNVLRGDRLIVDLTSGISRVESGKAGQGRVQGLFVPSGSNPNAKPESPPSPGAKPAPQRTSPSGSPIY
jgi:lipopolysaccharide export system protein LptA